MAGWTWVKEVLILSLPLSQVGKIPVSVPPAVCMGAKDFGYEWP